MNCKHRLSDIHRIKGTAIGVGQQGFNLIEVMIALAILSIGLLGIAAMQITAIDLNASANKDSEAVHLASMVLEEMIRDSGYNANEELADANGLVYGAYDVEQKIEVVPAGQMYTVTVSWKERGQERSTELSTLAPPVPK